MTEYGPRREDLVLRPVSGKALPVFSGEVLRISQTEGEQCVDFNAFNLHDYKERLDVGATRRTTGFRPAKGDIFFSNPPRYRPMLGILEMAPTCQTDLLGRSCHAVLFESAFGLDLHTSCQDTLAEAISEYGMTPDDVHDSFNLWMNTEWDSTGKWWVTENTGQAGDYVDLLALFDTLAVPVTCGSGDVRPTSNFSFKPIGVQVFEPSPDTLALVKSVQERYGSYRNQRSPDRFRVSNIKPDRELCAVPGWEPHFVNFPIRVEEVTVRLSREMQLAAQRLQEQGFGKDVSAVVRRAVMLWYSRHRTNYQPARLLSP